MAILRVKDNDGNVIPIPAIKGEKGDPGDVPASRKINGKELSADITLSASDVGAAPSGYGLGQKTGKECTDCNAAFENGWYRLSGDGCQNYPSKITASNYGVMLVSTRWSNETSNLVCQQVFYGGYQAIRFGNSIAGTWNPWEYVNPPMAEGVEYRTTERLGGKTVYTKRINCGTISSQTMSIDHNISMANILRFSGVIYAPTGTDIYGSQWTLPTYKAFDDMYVFANVSETSIEIVQDEYKTFNGWTCKAQLWYTKD